MGAAYSSLGRTKVFYAVLYKLCTDTRLVYARGFRFRYRAGGFEICSQKQGECCNTVCHYNSICITS